LEGGNGRARGGTYPQGDRAVSQAAQKILTYGRPGFRCPGRLSTFFQPCPVSLVLSGFRET
jgi:hypothetical protein